MPNDYYVTFVSNVSVSLYDGLNKIRDFRTKLSPAIKFDGRYEIALVDCILKDTHDILRKDRTYGIKVRHNDWPLVTDEWIASICSAECPFVTLKCIEYGCMTDLYCAINRQISSRKNIAFQFNYSMKQSKIYISSPIEKRRLFSTSLRDVLGFKNTLLHVLERKAT